ncbi:acyl-CoA dehydrogenase family protein [Novosphingobium lentum]|uniref:acyl-CoA dehydrogenase family protein n=1 Tax=Novosphingobium lentum TaxID=145287 RepID=UPI0008337CFB|nr:acyl-CoA dehydrogenase family protein [Novosphingobium lentum]
MDFARTPAEEEFRTALRTWLAGALPAGWGETVFEPEGEDARAQFRIEWEKTLHRGGWACIHWPREYGGRDASQVEQAIYAEELARARVPEGINIIGRNLAGSTLLAHGTEAQKQRFLPRIIACEEVWCQGFSEPGAGSDLASVRTRAELDGDHFVVNGQKVWTSYAQYSQWCFALVRTDPSVKKHAGLTFLLIDMTSPGVSTRPLKQISGENEFNETFFDNVRVPVENVVGEINGGWRIAMTTLAHERGPEDALGRQIRFKQELELLLETLSGLQRDGRPVIEQANVRQKLAQSVIELDIMRLSALRQLSQYENGMARGAEASANKLYWSHVAQDFFERAIDALGPLAPLAGHDPLAVGGGRFQLSYLQSRAFSIYSGSSEIQRNIIGERILGLPR